MSNFANRIAFKCTEKQWNQSLIDGVALDYRLVEIGYNMSELKFYPNMPYVATFYKKDNRKIGTTNTPFKDDRLVIEEWNADLFFALASQTTGNVVQVGEYFTDEKTGDCHRCTKIDGHWIRHDYGKMNIAFQRPLTHKSTHEELISFFSMKTVTEEIASEPIVKVKQSVKDKIATEVIAHQVAKAKNGRAKETTTVIDGNLLSLTDHPDAVLQVAKEDTTLVTITKNQVSPMTFQEILQWFCEGNEVCVGTVENGSVECKMYSINTVTKTAIGVDGDSAWIPFDRCFRNMSEFLKYALQQIA